MAVTTLRRCISAPTLEKSVKPTITKQISARRVSFNDVQVREYRIILGDHPFCSKGPPISAGWDYTEAGQFDIDEWEGKRQGGKRDLRLNAKERRDMLLASGYSPRNIRNSMSNNKDNSSQVVKKQMHIDRISVFEAAFEKSIKKLKRLSFSRKKPKNRNNNFGSIVKNSKHVNSFRQTSNRVAPQAPPVAKVTKNVTNVVPKRPLNNLTEKDPPNITSLSLSKATNKISMNTKDDGKSSNSLVLDHHVSFSTAIIEKIENKNGNRILGYFVLVYFMVFGCVLAITNSDEDGEHGNLRLLL